MSDFNTWLDTFIEEKGIDLEESFEVLGPSGMNYMSLQNVVDMMKITSASDQDALQKKIIFLDYKNQDIVLFFKYLAKSIAR